jgi:hypothetical protein
MMYETGLPLNVRKMCSCPLCEVRLSAVGARQRPVRLPARPGAGGQGSHSGSSAPSVTSAIPRSADRERRLRSAIPNDVPVRARASCLIVARRQPLGATPVAVRSTGAVANTPVKERILCHAFCAPAAHVLRGVDREGVRAPRSAAPNVAVGCGDRHEARQRYGHHSECGHASTHANSPNLPSYPRLPDATEPSRCSTHAVALTFHSRRHESVRVADPTGPGAPRPNRGDATAKASPAERASPTFAARPVLRCGAPAPVPVRIPRLELRSRRWVARASRPR